MIRVKIKVWFRNKFWKKLDKETLRGYRSLLKLIHHKTAEAPITDINPDGSVQRYFVIVPSLSMTLIINSDFAEIVNSDRIWPLNLNKKVYERIVGRLGKLKKQQITQIETSIKTKKQYILNDLYNKIK